MDNNIGEARRSYENTLGGGKFTQDDAAAFFDVSPSTYKKWEQGIGKLNGEILCAIADKFGVSVDYLLCRTDNPAPYPVSPHYKDQRQAMLNSRFDKLNDDGREEAWKAVDRLSRLPEFMEGSKSSADADEMGA